MATHQITGDEMIKKHEDKIRVLSVDEIIEKEVVEEIIEAREKYAQDRQEKEKEWTESFKMYMSYAEDAKNPFDSNLFIPKTHEAVEFLSANLIGGNQSISASPENDGDYIKAQVAEKYLDFLWRKVLKVRLKVLIWIKQGITFGNGILKVGWDDVNKKPFVSNTAIEDVYFDFYTSSIQDSPYIIHEIRKSIYDVMEDERYDKKDGDGNLIREMVVEGGTTGDTDETVIFATYDKAMNTEINAGKVPLMECWSKDTNQIITIAPTAMGYRILRVKDNPYNFEKGSSFRPFIKLRFKPSPIPNRAYDTGAIFPTIKIQKAFNGLMNEYFDNVVLINNKMWIKRRGARINPMELIRRPGGVITVGNIATDLRAEEVGDIKGSLVEMLNRLDHEFQEASMVVNLLKGLSESDTATGDALAQKNVQTLLGVVDENINEGLSELGQMILSITLDHAKGDVRLKVFEDDAKMGILTFDPKKIKGFFDVRITPDRSKSISDDVRQKQLLDFLSLVNQDANTLQRYPTLSEKIYRKWLELGGIGDVDFFFEQGQPVAVGIPEQSGGGGNLPGRDKLNSPEAIQQSVSTPTLTKFGV